MAKLSAEWPVIRFIEIWNGFAGVAPFGELKPIKKFTDRKVAVARIWQAIQRLDAEPAASSVTDEEARPGTEVAGTEQGPEIRPVAAPEQVSGPEVSDAVEVATVATQVHDVAPEVASATTDASTGQSAPAATAVTEPASTDQTATRSPSAKRLPSRRRNPPPALKQNRAGDRDAATARAAPEFSKAFYLGISDAGTQLHIVDGGSQHLIVPISGLW